MWPELLRTIPQIQELLNKTGEGVTPCSAFGVPEGLKAPLAAAAAADKPLLLLTYNEERANRLYDDLTTVMGEGVMLLPTRTLTLLPAAAQSREAEAMRVKVLQGLREGSVRAVVATWEAVACPQADPKDFDAGQLTLSQAQQIGTQQAALLLAGAGYTREDVVEGAGQYALRGGILDVFPTGAEVPLRIEFFGDEIDTIREFDSLTQRSIRRVEQTRIPPAGEVVLDFARLMQGLLRAQAALGEVQNDAQPQPEIMIDQAPIQGAVDQQALLSLWPDEVEESEDFDGTLWRDEEPAAKDDAPAQPAVPVAMPSGARMDGALAHLLQLVQAGILPSALTAFLPYIIQGKPFTLLDYYQTAPVVVMDEPVRLNERADNTRLEFEEQLTQGLAAGAALPGQAALHLGWEGLLIPALRHQVVTLQQLPRAVEGIRPRALVTLDATAMHAFHGKPEAIAQELKDWKRQQYRVMFFAGGAARARRLAESLEERGMTATCLDQPRLALPGEALVFSGALTQGFLSAAGKIAVVSDLDAFGAGRRALPRRSRSKQKSGEKLNAFTDLNTGDYVVHEDHGVGVYQGIKRLMVEGKTRDYLFIRFAGTDALYIPTDQMDRVQKYIGMESRSPKLNKLGGNEWARAKEKVREGVREMAEGLTQLYASRQGGKGYAFAPDSTWQRQFEENFPYEETADQLLCIEQIKRDMERPRPMDRLLCGDVGYGKTEVALRAAFKAVQDSKQVAILVPTTLLAQQHYQTVLQRFAGFPISVDLLCRFRTAAEQKQLLSRLKEGRIDVVVGTHRLLGKDIQFKDLGLLVIDEEQRFGVAHKEKIKQYKNQVDVLTMTATPIPRTLHMSLSGIRDMSLIENPPEERYPVQTFVVEFTDTQIASAIRRELARGGQVYIIYNRVRSIGRFAAFISSLVPEARIAAAHGQMGENQLEDVMLGFLEKRLDVLVSTTIIESGIDIPNANTMIVYDADHFGLSQLYQLRGRVGRSNRVAYAYFTYRRQKVLSEVAEKRLRAILEFTQFGSGFKIAMRDLEIRGAGNLLGPEQHGHLASVGYALYVKIMDEMMQQIRGEVTGEVADTAIEVRMDAFLPDGYVKSAAQKVEMYKRIAAIENEDDYDDVLEEMIDRYGDPPQSALGLMAIARLKMLCKRMGISRVTQRPGELQLRFMQSAAFDPRPLLKQLEQYTGRVTLMASDPPMLRVIQKGAEPEALVALSVEFLQKAQAEQ